MSNSILNGDGKHMRPVTLNELSVGSTVWYASLNSGLVEGTVRGPPQEDGRIAVDLPELNLTKPPSISKLYVVEGQPECSEAEVNQPLAVAAAAGRQILSCEELSLDVDSKDCEDYVATVVEYLEEAQKKALSAGRMLIAEMMDMLQQVGDKDVIHSLMRSKVPWSPQKYLAFQTVPHTAKKSILHITFLDYEPESYHAAGMYVYDAVLLFKSMKLSTLLSKTLEIRPKAAAKQSVFGWQADGAVMNSALCFAFTSLIGYAILHPDVSFPEPLARALGHIQAFYKKHENSQARLVSNLVESAAQRFASRSAHDPLFLAQEFSRHGFDSTYVKGIVKLYRNKTMLNGALAMPQKVEDAVIKLMLPNKVADGTKQIAIQASARHGWDIGPLCINFLLDTAFSLGSQFSETCHDNWIQMNTQTASGQMHAMQLNCNMFESAGYRMKAPEFHDLCVSCGLWANVCDKVLPLVSFSEKDIATLESEFDKDKTFREALCSLSSKDPPPAAGGATLAAWVIANVPQLKIQKQRIEDRTQIAGEHLASSMLGKAEAAALNAATYVSSITLDVDSYEKAVQKLADENATLEEVHARLMNEHVADVKRFQASMQGSDVRFWQPDVRKKLSSNKDWLEKAVNEANQHRKTLKTIHGLQEDDICQVNVICLYGLGTTKKGLLAAITRVLPSLKGLTLVFYPCIPKCLHRKDVSIGVVEGAADGVGQDLIAPSDSEGTDGDVEMHDFGRDGTLLPEVVTRVHCVKSSSQRAAQLAADHLEIDTAIGLADIEVRYPKRLTFLHAKDSHGDKDSTQAFLLIPTEDLPGINTDSLKESIMFQSGTFLEVPLPVSVQPMAHKVSRQAKRALLDHWSFDKECPRDMGHRFSVSKTCRGQAGVELHQMWLKDLAKTCGKKCLYIVDLACASGEVAKACIEAKISEEVMAQNVRLCSWSHDPRPSFHDIAQARGVTHLGKLYLDKKLQIPGHNPVAAPGEVPRKTRKLVRALLGAPLRVLSLSAEGNLLIPDVADVLRMCPEAAQAPELASKFIQWRAKYPRSAKSETADGVTGEGASGVSGAETGETATETSQAGTIVASQQEVEKAGESIVKQEKLPPVQGPIYKKLQLVLCAKPNGGHRMWLVNTSEQQVSVPTGTYLGQAGPGIFVSVANTALTEEQKPFAWRWNRITSHKRDSAEAANAFLILVKDLNESADGDPVKPKLVTMEDIEKDIGINTSLYGHSITRGGALKVTITPSPTPIVFVSNMNPDPSTFSWKTLGAWLPSLENTTGTTLKLEGLVRPVFEVTSGANNTSGVAGSSNSGSIVKPVNVTNRNCIHFFTCKKIELAAKAWIALS